MTTMYSDYLAALRHGLGPDYHVGASTPRRSSATDAIIWTVFVTFRGEVKYASLLCPSRERFSDQVADAIEQIKVAFK